MRIVNEAQSIGEPVFAEAPTLNRNTTEAATHLNRTGSSWVNTLGAGRTVSWGWRASPPGYTNPSGVGSSNYANPSFRQFNEAQRASTLRAIAAVGDVSGIQFSQASSGFTNSATILFGSFTQGSSFAHGYFPHPNATDSGYAHGDVWTNVTSADNSTNLGFNQYGLLTLIHEIGHAVGLSHPGAYDASQGTFTYNNHAEYIQDTRQYTVMSYFQASNTGANHVYNGTTIYASTLLMHDIAALQRMYGVRSARAGNTVYGFNSNSDLEAYRITSSTMQRVFCIWDSGGIDTLDFSGYSNNQRINLNAETFSDVGALTRNVSIARGAVIENAIGGSGNDTLIGNQVNNEFQGNGGNDDINGGGGTNTAIYRGARSQYTITSLGSGRYRITDNQTGRDGVDTLTNIQRARFTDQTVDLTAGPDPDPDPTNAPTIRVAYQRFELIGTRRQAMNTLFEVSDPDNDITRVAVRDGGSGLGRLMIGSRVLAAREWHYLSLAEYNQLYYRGRGAGTETLQVNAFDSGGRSAGTQAFSIYSGDFAGGPTTAGVMRNNYRVRGTLRYAEGGRADTTDWYRTRLTAGTYLIRLRGASSGGGSMADPLLRIMDASGREIAMNDDGGVGRDAQLTFTVTETTHVYLVVDAYGSSERGTYQLRVNRTSSGFVEPESDEGDKPSTAVNPVVTHVPDARLCSCASCAGTVPEAFLADDPAADDSTSDTSVPKAVVSTDPIGIDASVPSLVDCGIGAEGTATKVGDVVSDPSPVDCGLGGEGSSVDSGPLLETPSPVDCELNTVSPYTKTVQTNWSSTVDTNSMSRIGSGLAGGSNWAEERRSHPFAGVLAA